MLQNTFPSYRYLYFWRTRLTDNFQFNALNAIISSNPTLLSIKGAFQTATKHKVPTNVVVPTKVTRSHQINKTLHTVIKISSASACLNIPLCKHLIDVISYYVLWPCCNSYQWQWAIITTDLDTVPRIQYFRVKMCLLKAWTTGCW